MLTKQGSRVVSFALAFGILQWTTTAAQSAGEGATPSAPDALQEVIITGLKRDARYVDVPVTVQVFDAERIERSGITRSQDYLLLAPNVTFYESNYAGDFFINIRGQASIRASEPAVAVVVDGVALGNQQEFNTTLFDLKQIEILKGPQGALYGRNASAGAIVITTTPPTNEISGQSTIGFGNDNSYNFNTSLGGAIVEDKLLFRVAGSVKNTDGSYTNINTGESAQRYRESNARARLDWKVSDALKLDLRVGGLKGIGGGLAFTPKFGVWPGVLPNGSVVGGVEVRDISTNDNIDIPFTTDVQGHYDRDMMNASLKADYAPQGWLGGATLTSVTAFSEATDNYGGKNAPYQSPGDSSSDFGIVPLIFGDVSQNYRVNNRTFNQELRLTSASDTRLRWQVGLQYIDAKRTFLTNNALNGAVPGSIADADLAGFVGYDAMGNRVLIGGGVSPRWNPYRLLDRNSNTPSISFQQNNTGGENFSQFGNLGFDLTPQLALQLAVRYDTEKRTEQAVGPDLPNVFIGGASFNPCVRITGQTAAQCADGIDKTFSQLQPKVSLVYKFMDDSSSIFASWGRSFKTGGVNAIGTRETLVQARIPIYLAEGQSLPQATASAQAAVLTQDFYDKEVSDSAELGVKLRLFDRRLDLSAAVFATDTSNAQQYRFDPIAFIQAIDGVDKVETRGFEFDARLRISDAFTLFGSYGHVESEVKRLASAPEFEGNFFPYIPEYTSSFGIDSVLPLGGAVNLLSHVEYTLTGPVWWDIQNTPTTQRDSVGLLNARLALSGEKWEMALWGRNLTDELYPTEAVVVLPPLINILYKAPGRTFGAELKYRF